MTPRLHLFTLGLLTGLLLCSCRRDTIRVYTAPKDLPAPAVAADHSDHSGPAPAAEAPAARPRPAVTWTLPAGWEQTTAGQVSAAQFVIKASEGEATVNITPLPNLAGKESMVINMWREQIGLPALAAEQVGATLSPVEVAGGQGQLFEISGTREGASTHIITAMLHQPDSSWFFKLAGPSAAVTGQKAIFIEFLKSVRIGAIPPAQP